MPSLTYDLWRHWYDTGEWQAFHDHLVELGCPMLADMHVEHCACNRIWRQQYCLLSKSFQGVLMAGGELEIYANARGWNV